MLFVLFACSVICFLLCNIFFHDVCFFFQDMAAVVVNEYGQPVSRNCTTAGHRKGSLVRTHVPVSYKNWKLVPQKHKDDVWNTLKVQNLP